MSTNSPTKRQTEPTSIRSPTSHKPNQTSTATPSEPQQQEPTWAQRKAAAKAEKAARRAAQKPQTSSSTPGPASSKDAQNIKQDVKHQRQPSSTAKPAQQPQLPMRTRRQSNTPANVSPPKQKTSKAKQLPFLSHLYSSRRRPTYAQLLHPSTHRDIHPSVQTLALHLESYKLCGSQARTIALLLALKAVIRGYTTPQGTSLPRDLSSRGLSAQLNHIKSHGRPFCTAQSNAVRWLKNRIATLDPSLPETGAINTISSSIDEFIRERFTVADTVIAQAAAGSSDAGEARQFSTAERGLLEDGDDVLVFGKSAVVCASLREAAIRGKRFTVVCIEGGRPLWEGQTMSRSLASLRLKEKELSEGETQGSNKHKKGGITSLMYVSLSQLHSHLMLSPVTKVLFGANTIYSNGSILSRAGQAQTALAVRTECPGAHLFVLAESIKCTERAVLGTNSLAVAELAPENELIYANPEEDISKAASMDSIGTHEKGQDISENKRLGEGLAGWEEKEGLYLMNLLHDVTPPDLIDVIVTEVGSVPPSAAAAVGRMVGVDGELGEV